MVEAWDTKGYSSRLLKNYRAPSCGVKTKFQCRVTVSTRLPAGFFLPDIRSRRFSTVCQQSSEKPPQRESGFG
jgi:hypothetical protein